MRSMVFGAVVAFCSAAAFPAYGFFGLFSPKTEKVSAVDGMILVRESDIKKEAAKFFEYTEQGKVIRFFLVRDAKGTIRGALDACEACWRDGKGYIFDRDSMVCVSCNQRFPLARIGMVKGGCNPHPITMTSSSATVMISADELAAGAHYFPDEQ